MSTALRRAYYWKGMLKEATTFARSCPICQPHMHDKRSKAGFMAPQETPIRPWSSIALDFFGPLATHGSKQKDSVNMILVAVCRLTKMSHFILSGSLERAYRYYVRLRSGAMLHRNSW